MVALGSTAWRRLCPSATLAPMRTLVAILSLHLGLCLVFTALTAAFLALMRGDRLHPHRQAIGWFFREWLGTALIVGSLPLGMWPSGPAPSRRAARRDPDQLPSPGTAAPPVLLVPGYALNRASFYWLALFLRRRGWRWVWGINNRPTSRPVPIYAHHLAEQVEALCLASSSDQVDLVAHSMGGLVAAWYIQHLGGDRRVRRVVSLGTPWAGSRIAVFGLRREALDLLPGSPIQVALSPPRVPWTAVWSREDNIVLPPHSALIPGVEPVLVTWVGHISMLLSARVYRIVADSLAAPERPLGVTDPLNSDLLGQRPAVEGDRGSASSTLTS